MRVEPAVAVVGHVAVPGDKSISHRAVLIGSIAEGETRVTGFGRSGDTQATVDGMRALGVEIEWVGEDELVVHGVGLRGLRAGAVDCANSGTLMRLLAGIARGAGRRVHPHRRRVAEHAADEADRRAAAAGWAPTWRRPTATRRSSSAAPARCAAPSSSRRSRARR